MNIIYKQHNNKGNKMSINIDYIDMYGIEIVGKEAYTERLTTQTAYGKDRGNDFEGTKEACLTYIEKKGVSVVYGALSDIQ